jgi:hypothetical protein
VRIVRHFSLWEEECVLKSGDLIIDGKCVLEEKRQIFSQDTV